MNLLFDLDPLSQPQQLGWVFYDKMNLVQKLRFIKQVKKENFFKDFLYRKFNDFEHFMSEAKK
jgi:hypothetical protein